MLVGFAAAFPIVLYQVIAFVRPGLKGSERRLLYLLLPGGTILFLAGAAFAYYLIIPPAIHFLLQFGGEIALVTPRLSSYVSLVTTLTIWMGLIFELPIAMFLLAKLGVLRPEGLSKQRRWVIFVRVRLSGGGDADGRPGDTDLGRRTSRGAVRVRAAFGEDGDAR